MKRFPVAITLLSFTLGACIPAAAATPQPGPSPTATQAAAAKLESTPVKQVQAAVADKPKGESKPTRQARPASTATSKGKTLPSASASANPDFIATEVLGRPTNTSITVNVVPAVAMKIYYEYGTAKGVYTAQTTPQSASAGVPLETLIEGLQPNTRYYLSPSL